MLRIKPFVMGHLVSALLVGAGAGAFLAAEAMLIGGLGMLVGAVVSSFVCQWKPGVEAPAEPLLVQAAEANELPDMVRDTRRLPHDVFLAESLRHRFCLIPPGDVGHASPKISEGIALGAARGCIPVIVLPFNSARETRRFLGTFLPFTRWLDYCSVTYLVVRPSGSVSLRALGDIGHLPPELTTFSMHHGLEW